MFEVSTGWLVIMVFVQLIFGVGVPLYGSRQPGFRRLSEKADNPGTVRFLFFAAFFFGWPWYLFRSIRKLMV